jgi:hypothetical protein
VARIAAGAVAHGAVHRRPELLEFSGLQQAANANETLSLEARDFRGSDASLFHGEMFSDSGAGDKACAG